jgi:hypothetical protein
MKKSNYNVIRRVLKLRDETSSSWVVFKNAFGTWKLALDLLDLLPEALPGLLAQYRLRVPTKCLHTENRKNAIRKLKHASTHTPTTHKVTTNACKHCTKHASTRQLCCSLGRIDPSNCIKLPILRVYPEDLKNSFSKKNILGTRYAFSRCEGQSSSGSSQ